MSFELKYYSNDDKLVRGIAFLAPIEHRRGYYIQVQEETIELVKNFMGQSSVKEVKDLVTAKMDSLTRKQVDILHDHLQTVFIEFDETLKASKVFSQAYRQLQRDLKLIKEMLDLTESRIDNLEVEANKRHFKAERAKDANTKGRVRSPSLDSLSVSSDSDPVNIVDLED